MRWRGSHRPVVFLHIGPPKTGTTYIQGTLRHWHAELRRCGVLFPRNPTLDHFTAAIDARGPDHSFGAAADERVRRAAVGAWSRLAKKAASYPGTVVISHELFATADAAHAQQVVRDLDDADLHVVVTARDPARQIVSSWQQRIKQGAVQEFADVERKVARRRRLSSVQDLSDLLERWGSQLPPGHLHVVTLPQSDPDPDVLWRRFASVVGIDAARFEPPMMSHANPALGVAEAEFLRRVNVALDGRLANRAYGAVVTRMFARGILAGVRTSPKSVLPATLVPVADEIAERWIRDITERGYDVVGDLSELRPVHRLGQGPSDAAEPEVAAAAVAATAALLVDVARSSRQRGVVRRAIASATGGRRAPHRRTSPGVPPT